MKMFTTSKKTAITFTYISILMQALSTMILTSFYLKELGADKYGLFQMINAVAQYILILDLGISTVMVRYISEFDVRDNHKKSENFAFHFGIIVLLVVVFVIVLGMIVNCNLENIYQKLTPEEYEVSHAMFRFIIIQLVFTVLGHYFQGISFAYEQYSFEKLLSIFKLIFNTVLIILLVKAGMGILGIVVANASVIILHTLISAFYAFFAVKFRIRFHGWEFSMLQPAFLLMLAMLMQAIVGHVNSSVDKTILGIMTTKTDVAVYAVAATIITMFNTLPTSISSIFQPDAVKLVAKGADGEKLTDFVIRPGRFQFILTAGFMSGFFLFGSDFIVCWTNKNMTDAWVYVLIIMIPSIVPMVQNTCLTILNAKDKRLFRSLILVVITVLNIGMTVAFIPVIGPIGAPLATGIAYVLGHVIIINIYYQKKIGLKIPLMFFGIVRRLWLCPVAALLLNLPLMFWKVDGSWLVLGVKALAFCVVYIAALLIFGLNSEEKKMLKSITGKFRRR